MNLEPAFLYRHCTFMIEAADSIRRAEVLDDKDSIKITKIISLIDLFGKNLSIFHHEILEIQLI